MTRTCSCNRPLGAGTAAADRLALARTELALAAGPAPDVAVAHLAFLLDFVPEPARRPFLFACWQEWTRTTVATRRHALVVRAWDVAAQLLRDGVGLPVDGPARAPWRRYRAAVTAAFGDHHPVTDAVPLNFLIFDHAHRTHRSLGVPEPDDAVAAWALRAVPPVPRPDTAGARTGRLQAARS